MTPSPTPRPSLLAACLLLAALTAASGCRRRGDSPPPAPGPPESAVLQVNHLANLPGEIYRSQQDSLIRWQPWTLETFEEARLANRLVFAVIAMPQQPGYHEVMETFSNSTRVREAIELNYVPVLVDGDAIREMGLLVGDLCTEINRPVSVPLMVWFTPHIRPVAWIPAPLRDPAGLLRVFDQSHTMVSRTWRNEPSYVVENSEADNQSRAERLGRRRNTRVASERPAEEVLVALRQLAALYDPITRQFEESGGLFPAGVLDLMATSAMMPGLGPEVRERSASSLREMLRDMALGAVFDPLDDGLFNSRRGQSWLFPGFSRDAASQARSAAALLRAHQAVDEPLALDRALGIVNHLEQRHANEDGLFSLGVSRSRADLDWMWTIDQVADVLPAEDLKWWLEITAMSELGNLPSELDPRRDYFRHNVPRYPDDRDWGAAERERFERCRALLLAERERRFGTDRTDRTPHLGATLRMVSTYVAAFTATGDEEFRRKAVRSLEAAREAFSVGPELRVHPVEAPPSVNSARAFLYALALQAALDVADITSDERWVLWADDLATVAAEKFTAEGLLRECPLEAVVLDLPVTDIAMLFDDSTAGLISMAEWRLAARGRPLVRSFSELAVPLPSFAIRRPVLHTDLLHAVLNRHHAWTVVPGADLDPALTALIERLPPRVFKLREPLAADSLPSGAVLLLDGRGGRQVVSEPEAFREALLLPAGDL